MFASSACNFSNPIVSSSKKNRQSFRQHALRNRRFDVHSSSTGINTVSATSSTANLKLKGGHAQGSHHLCLANNITAKKAFGNIIDHNIPRKLDMITFEDVMKGKLLDCGLVYQNYFFTKSYELDAFGQATMVSILNQLQDSAINHFRSCGLVAAGMGCTSEMEKRSLIWVVHKLQVVVDRYPAWNDIAQLSTWASAAGKYKFRRDWIIRDHKTGEVLIRAVCFYAIINKETRKLSKLDDEVRAELNPFFLDCDPIIEEDTILQNLDVHSPDCIRTDIVARQSDLDMNQHINHINYVNWIIESAPRRLPEDHRLSAMTLKYQRECGIDSVLQSLSTPIEASINGKDDQIKLHHSLLKNGIEVVSGSTVWTPKPF